MSIGGFNVASGSFTLTRTGSTSSYITFKCNWSSTSNGSAANTSTVTVTIVASKSSSSTANTYGNYTASATVNGTAQSVGSTSFTLAPGKSITLLSKSYTVPHNSDGTKSTNISATVGGNVMYGNGSSLVTLDKIPRYGTANQTLNNKTETSVVMNWSSDSIVDYIWYSTNNGSSWTGVNVTDGKSGGYTINGLSANTTYNIKTRIRRKDSQLTTDSAALSVTTFAYPYATSMPSFTIGSKLTLGLYNPLNRSITVNILGADGSQISNDTTTGTSISGYNGDTVVNRFYASIPNSQSGTYRVKVTYGNQVSTKTGGTYTVNLTVCKPSIGACSYLDTNNTVTAITNNNQWIVRNQSSVKLTASNLVGNKSASISSCKVVVNANSYNMSLSGGNATVSNIVIDSSSNVTATFTVTDSRGVTNTQNLNITILDWTLPTAIINLQRQNNFYSESDINVNAEYSSINGKNTITIKARYKKITDTSYGSYVTLQDNVTSVLTLDNNYEWDVQVLVSDKFGSTTYNLTLSRGMPIIYFDRTLSSTGFNCFPKNEKSLEVNGYNLVKNIMTGYFDTTLTNLTESSYTIVPLNNERSIGDELTLTANGGIKIGSGISAVLVSGRLAFNTIPSAGVRHLRIMKNSYTNNNTIGWTQKTFAASQPDSLIITPTLAAVNEGDIIYLWYYTTNSTDVIGGNAYGCRTSLTVESVG